VIQALREDEVNVSEGDRSSCPVARYVEERVILQPIVRHCIDAAVLERQELEVDSGEPAVFVGPAGRCALDDDDAVADDPVPDVGDWRRVIPAVPDAGRDVRVAKVKPVQRFEVEILERNGRRIVNGQRLAISHALAQ
jgi:hypothetical protein